MKLAMGTPGIDVEQYLGWRMRREGITVAVRAKVSEFILSHKVVAGRRYADPVGTKGAVRNGLCDPGHENAIKMVWGGGGGKSLRMWV